MSSTPHSALVHPIETFEQRPIGELPVEEFPPRPEFQVQPITPAETTFRHSGWLPLRQKIWKALVSLNTHSTRLNRFRNCGSALWLFLHRDDNELSLRANHCHDRWCIPCNQARAQQIRSTVEALAKQGNVRMITWTLRHSKTPLRDQITRLKSSFRTLRRRTEWLAHVDAGIAFIETKISSTDGLWHVHMHIIAHGSFFPHATLSRLWHAITGDSSIVHIGQHGTPAAIAHYAAKYCTKPADASVFSCPEKLAELITALKGTRLYDKFGEWRLLEFEETPSGASNKRGTPLGELSTLANEARQGDPEAIRWIEAAVRKWPTLALLVQSS